LDIQFIRRLVSGGLIAHIEQSYFGTARRPRASVSTSPVTALTVDEVAALPSNDSLIALTSDEPTTTPSAALAIPAALSALFTPNPTTTGSFVCRFNRATASPTSLAFGAADPVTPVIETK
jgi:hypothetical protein